jgi:hypothetical protein
MYLKRAVPTRTESQYRVGKAPCNRINRGNAVCGAFATLRRVDHDLPASSRKCCTTSNSIIRFFSMMIVCVPSGSIT